jgi:DNA-binding NtrC family response regulator
LLFEFFVLQAALRYGQPALVSGELVASLMAQRWAGNVRELHNVADRFVLGLLDDTLSPAGCREASWRNRSTPSKFPSSRKPCAATTATSSTRPPP